MIITVQDLAKYNILGFMPEEVSYLKQGQYLTFFYNFSDELGSILSIRNVKIVDHLVLSCYNGLSPSERFGYFTEGFNTQSKLFYLVLSYGVLMSENKEQNETILKNCFIEFKKRDIDSAKAKLEKTTYGNIFPVFSRQNFVTAFNQFVIGDDIYKLPALSIFDMVDGYLNKVQKKGLYGPTLNKIVKAIPNPNGGFITEYGNKLKYFSVGEKSNIVKNNPNFSQAKELYRQGIPINDIFIQTGFWRSKFDTMWRFAINGDESASIIHPEPNFIFRKKDSNFPYEVNSNRLLDDNYLRGLTLKGWDTVLGDVLTFPELYKHYPSLYNTKIFYGAETTERYNFYYQPSNKYLVIYGDPNKWDIKTVLLHEVQHAVQAIEGFATGGSPDVAKMIQAIGGNGVKEYFFTVDYIKKIFLQEAREGGTYSFTFYNLLAKDNGFTIYTQEQYYNGREAIFMQILGFRANLARAVAGANSTEATSIDKFLGEEIVKGFKVIIDLAEKAEKMTGRLIGSGFTREQAQYSYFRAYESLLGEMEARDTQHSANIVFPVDNYFLPITSESIPDEEVNVAFEMNYEEEEKSFVPTSPMGAIEKDENGKFTIHLYESFNTDPILHELGHIVFQSLTADDQQSILSKMTNALTAEKITEAGGNEEVFCQLFIAYIFNLNLDEDFNSEFARGNKFKESKFLNSEFSQILNFDLIDTKASDKEYEDRKKYLSLLLTEITKESKVEVIDGGVNGIAFINNDGSSEDLISAVFDFLKKQNPDQAPEQDIEEEEREEEEEQEEESQPMPELTPKQKILQKCTIEGNVVKLPEGQLDRKLYEEVKNALELIGGKWKGGKTAGFVFLTDPTELLAEISLGAKRNLKKEYQFFGTPDVLSDELVAYAQIKESDIVLEPSAGQGAIVKAINRVYPKMKVYCYESMAVNKIFLNKIPQVQLIGDDFLAHGDKKFDKIIANPPFAKNQDIDHVKEMFSCLKPGGRLVSITSNHWEKSTNKKETAFRNWLSEVGAEIKQIGRGAFKESGTTVGGLILIINKPKNS